MYLNAKTKVINILRHKVIKLSTDSCILPQKSGVTVRPNIAQLNQIWTGVSGKPMVRAVSSKYIYFTIMGQA